MRVKRPRTRRWRRREEACAAKCDAGRTDGSNLRNVLVSCQTVSLGIDSDSTTSWRHFSLKICESERPYKWVKGRSILH